MTSPESDIPVYDPLEDETSPEYAQLALKEILQQTPKTILEGGLGAYGDILELVGLQPKVDPREERQRQKELSVFEKMEDPNYKPSFSDIESLSEDDILPTSFRLPTTQAVKEVGEGLGLPGKPKTTAGKYTERIGTTYGQGLPFGQINPLPAIISGTTGQLAEEFGADPLLQGAIEIASLYATGGKQAPTDAAKKSIRDRIQNLREIGHSEQDITLAINAAEKSKKGLLSRARKSQKTQEAIDNVTKNSDQFINDILTQQIPGIEHGTKYVHDVARNAYQGVIDKFGNIKISNSKYFDDAVNSVIKRLNVNLGTGPEAEEFISRLQKAKNVAQKNPNAEHYIEFYKELNKAGKWLDPTKKEELIKVVKNGIFDAFETSGSQGRQLAERFEDVNKGIQRAYRAEAAHDLIQGAITMEGTNYNKLNKLFDKQENWTTLENALGQKATNNLYQISKVGKDIKNFDKAYKGTTQGLGFSDAIITFLSHQYYHSPEKAAAVFLAKKGLGEIGRRLSEKMLTDPKYQNLIIRGLNAIKNESPRSFLKVQESMQKYFNEEGIEIDLFEGKD